MTQRSHHPLVRAVRDRLDREQLGGRPLLVAFSGGPDSLALLVSLHVLGVPVQAAHLNHRLRGDESDGDQAFAEDFCRSRGIPLYVEQKDVACFARESGINLEAAARQIRYEWLGETAKRAGLGFVATGHTADDQAETVLHHLIRGAGLRGLRGIAARKPLAVGVELIRPHLTVTRDQVLDFLRDQALSARLDSSNLDLKMTRNRIRHELLPLMRTFNREFVLTLCRLAEQADDLFRERDADSARLLTQVERPRAGSVVVLDGTRLAHAGRNQVRELFYTLWEREGWPVGEMSFAHWDRLAALVFDGAVAHDLPGGIRATRKSNVVQLHRRSGFSSSMATDERG